MSSNLFTPLNVECPSLPTLAHVQTDERSSADKTQMKAGITQYAFVKTKYTDNNKSPKFASHTDYITWKRMNAQLHS